MDKNTIVSAFGEGEEVINYTRVYCVRVATFIPLFTNIKKARQARKISQVNFEEGSRVLSLKLDTMLGLPYLFFCLLVLIR